MEDPVRQGGEVGTFEYGWLRGHHMGTNEGRHGLDPALVTDDTAVHFALGNALLSGRLTPMPTSSSSTTRSLLRLPSIIERKNRSSWQRKSSTTSGGPSRSPVGQRDPHRRSRHRGHPRPSSAVCWASCGYRPVATVALPFMHRQKRQECWPTCSRASLIHCVQPQAMGVSTDRPPPG